MINFFEKGVNIAYDSINRDEFLRRWAHVNSPSENEILIMFGIGTGMFIKYLLLHSACYGRIIVIEPSIDIYEEAIRDEEVLRCTESEKLDIIIDNISDKFVNNILYNKLLGQNGITLKIAIYPNYNHLFAEEYKRFLDTVDEVCDMVSAAEIVDNRFSEVINKNIRINTNRLKGSYSIADFAAKVSKDIPVIIAASGPSLSKNILYLKQAKGKSLIVGLDSSLPALLKEDIIPDVYFSIDPTKIAKHFEDERIKNIPAIAVLQSPEHVIKDGQKYFFIFNGDEEILSSLKEQKVNVTVVPPLGSVANTAFTLMNMIGFKTIIFVGQDLAYTDDKYHAENTVHNEKTFKQDTIIYLPGIDGEAVKSSREFRMYKSGFEKIIEMFPEHTFIDATEGGAYIEGTKVKTLSDVVNEYCTKNFRINDYFENIESLIKESD